MLTRLFVGLSSLWGVVALACGWLGAPLASAQHIDLASSPEQWYQRVGSSDFDMQRAVDIADYCGPNEADATSCVLEWIQAATAASTDGTVHLFASAGSYGVAGGIALQSGMHLRCASQDVVFRSLDQQPIFADRQTVDVLEDILVEGCAFDTYGEPSRTATVFLVDRATGVTFRNNRIFDSGGLPCDSRECRRDYTRMFRVQDVLIANNHFSQGGGLQVQGPGRRVVVRDNFLDFVSGVGISLRSRAGENWPDGTNVSEDYLIEGNTIGNPLTYGIAVGVLGDGSGVTTRRVTLLNNTIVGTTAQCVGARLPEHAADFFIGNTRCDVQTRLGEYCSGIHLFQTSGVDPTNDTDLRGTLFRNHIESNTFGFGVAGIFIDSLDACLIRNTVRNAGVSVWTRDDAKAYLDEASLANVGGQAWGAGQKRMDSDEEVPLDSLSGECPGPDFLAPAYP